VNVFYTNERTNLDDIDMAHREGYNAGWEFHLGNGTRADNPYDYDSKEYDAW
jgi:hypothetical protein